MCEHYIAGKEKSRYLNGKPVEQSFTPELVHAFPPIHARQGHCLFCGTPLSQEEMFPKGRAPRYACKNCYEHAAYNSGNFHCLPFGQRLPNFNSQMREKYPRELRYAFCDGSECWEYWKVLAGRVLGVDFNVTNALPPVQTPGVIQLPCRSEPEPIRILPAFNQGYRQSQFAYAEIRYMLDR